jgi:ABC-2 type transport system ATP-binding protein
MCAQCNTDEPAIALAVQGVVKQFRDVTAVDHLSFQVRRGEVFALLGPNGAGKTTMVRMLMGLLRPDAGAIRYRLAGATPRWPLATQLGYLPEERGLYQELPILRVLIFFGVLRGMGKASATEAAQEWLERLGLQDQVHHRVDSLSKGNQQKVQFAAAILHRPQFAVLDEPFSGLDPVNQELLLRLIGDLRDEGMTLLLCAHQMSLVERLADEVLLINRGRAVLQGTLADIRQRSAVGHRLRLRVSGHPDLSPLAGHPEIQRLEWEGDELILQLRAPASDGSPGPAPGALNRVLAAVALHIPTTAVVTEAVGLHALFVQAVAGGRIDGEGQPSQRQEAP